MLAKFVGVVAKQFIAVVDADSGKKNAEFLSGSSMIFMDTTKLFGQNSKLSIKVRHVLFIITISRSFGKAH